MTAEQSGDPFGASVRERVWRRLAGAGVAVTVAALGVGLWDVELLPFVWMGAIFVYVLGVPASWAVTRRGGAPIRRHVGAGVVVGVVVAAPLGLLFTGELLAWPIMAGITVLFGVPAAAAAAVSGLRLPRRWVKPVAVVGLVVTAVVLPVGRWLDQRPPAPYDYVYVLEPDGVRDHFEDPYALAVDIAERFEEAVDAGARGRAHATWVSVGGELSNHELDIVAAWLHYTPDGQLPSLRSSGEPVRLVTTIFDGEASRGCVIVTDTASRAEPHACAQLGLVR